MPIYTLQLAHAKAERAALAGNCYSHAHTAVAAQTCRANLLNPQINTHTTRAFHIWQLPDSARQSPDSCQTVARQLSVPNLDPTYPHSFTNADNEVGS